MKFFLDTEYNEDGRTIDLISIGVVCENGVHFYRQNAGINFKRLNPWVERNVIPKLWSCPEGIPGPQHKFGQCAAVATCVWRPNTIRIAQELKDWVNDQCQPKHIERADPDPNCVPEFWGEDCAYDFVAVSWLFGGINGNPGWPVGWPYYFLDVDAVRHQLGIASYPPAQEGSHNALTDARYVKATWQYLSIQEQFGGGWSARQRDEQEVSARQVDQESGDVRSDERAGYVEVAGGGDVERPDE